jgi:hypothetical protein
MDIDHPHNKTPFYIYPQDSSSRYVLSGWVENITSNPSQFPDGTIGTEEFPLDFNIERGEFIERQEFLLMDHEGGALRGSKSKAVAEKYDNIINELKSFDSFICFLSAEHLMDSRSMLKSEWQTIKNIIQDVASRLNPHDKLPISVVISKFDIAKEKNKEQEVLIKATEIIKSLSKVLPNTTFMLCPINVVKSDGLGNYIMDSPPKNLAAPFLFSISGIILRNAALLMHWAKEEMVEVQNKRKEIENRKIENPGFFGWFKRVIPNLKSRFSAYRKDKESKRYVGLSNNDIILAEEAFSVISKIPTENKVKFIFRGNELSSQEYLTESFKIGVVYE